MTEVLRRTASGRRSVSSLSTDRIEQARVVNELTAQSRERARADAVRIIRQLEERLITALSGEVLRGLPNLCRDAAKPFFAIRARCGDASDPLPWDGRAVLVLALDGHLRMAMRQEDKTLRPVTEVVSWLAEDKDILAEDLACVTKRMNEALENHLTKAVKATERYTAVSDLAERLSMVLKR